MSEEMRTSIGAASWEQQLSGSQRQGIGAGVELLI